jgi:hypothetical protein
MFHTRVVGAKTLEQLLLGEDLPTAGIGGYVSYVGRRSRRRQCKAIGRFLLLLGPNLVVAEPKEGKDIPVGIGDLEAPQPIIDERQFLHERRAPLAKLVEERVGV